MAPALVCVFFRLPLVLGDLNSSWNQSSSSVATGLCLEQRLGWCLVQAVGQLAGMNWFAGSWDLEEILIFVCVVGFFYAVAIVATHETMCLCMEYS